jgi:rubrerythrin
LAVNQELALTTPTQHQSPVRSVDELLAMAVSIEHDAARRYRELAARMRLRDAPHVAAIFDLLASIEAKHAVAIADSGGQSTEAMEKPTTNGESPETFDAEAGSAQDLTPYRALAISVRNEERAFVFYSYIAAHAPTEVIRKLAEGLAKDELAHATLLRRERRKAYREAGREPFRQARPLPQTLDAFWRLCAESDLRAAAYHRAYAQLIGAASSAAASLMSIADDEAACAMDASAKSSRSDAAVSAPTGPTYNGAVRLIEEAFDLYADIAARSQNEAVMLAAQEMAARVVQRLSALPQRDIGAVA